MAKKKVSLKLEVRVTYIPNGVSVEDLKWHLEQIVTNAMNNGGFTGDTAAEVEAVWKEVTKIDRVNVGTALFKTVTQGLTEFYPCLKKTHIRNILWTLVKDDFLKDPLPNQADYERLKTLTEKAINNHLIF